MSDLNNATHLNKATHKYLIGSLVEFNNGPRLWVVYHATDCDAAETPLYCLAVNPHDTQLQRAGFYNSSWTVGVPEGMLRFIRMLDGPEAGDE